MGNKNKVPPVANTNPVVENQVIDQNINVRPTVLRPLPEVDRNEIHCIFDPVYQGNLGQNIISQPQTSNIGYSSQAPEQKGSGMVREEGYV